MTPPVSTAIMQKWSRLDTLEYPARYLFIVWETVAMMDATPIPKHPEHTSTSEATFGMKRAAQVAGISVSTIRRHKDTLRKYGAIIEPEGWQVPISALVAADLMRPQTPPDKMPATEQDTTTSKATSAEQESDQRLEIERLRHRAEMAEREVELLREAHEREVSGLMGQRDTLEESLRMTRRMLPIRPEPDTTPTPAPEQTARNQEQEHHHEQAPVAPRASWFKRAFG